MIALALFIAFVLLLVVLLSVAIGRDEARSDRRDDPFRQETARLAAAGLIHERRRRDGTGPIIGFDVTPAGEAALRAWEARERSCTRPAALLGLSFAGITGPSALQARCEERMRDHEARAKRFEVLAKALENAPEFGDDAFRLAELGRRYEQSCEAFWTDQLMDGTNR